MVALMGAGKEGMVKTMEIRTLDEFFIAKYGALEAKNAELRYELERFREETAALRGEVGKAKAFVAKYLCVDRETCGKNGERRLSLRGKANEWLAFGEAERAEAEEAIEYALSMGAADETADAAADGDVAEAEGDKR